MCVAALAYVLINLCEVDPLSYLYGLGIDVPRLLEEELSSRMKKRRFRDSNWIDLTSPEADIITLEADTKRVWGGDLCRLACCGSDKFWRLLLGLELESELAISHLCSAAVGRRSGLQTFANSAAGPDSSKRIHIPMHAHACRHTW